MGAFLLRVLQMSLAGAFELTRESLPSFRVHIAGRPRYRSRRDPEYLKEVDAIGRWVMWLRRVEARFGELEK
jgi:hypothetical protein